MTRKSRLTEKAVERLRVEPDKYDVKDEATTGLYLRVSPSGKKSWRYRYTISGKVRIITLGDWPTLSLIDARAQAGQHKRLVDEGDDPLAAKQEAAAHKKRMPTVEDFVAEYINRYAKPNKKTWKPDEQMLRRWVVPTIGLIKMNKVKRRDIVGILDKIHDTGATRLPGKVLAVTRKMFRFAVERGVLDQSPVQYITERQPKPKPRAMAIETARAFWEKSGAELVSPTPSVLRQYALGIRLLALTGQRPGEVCNAQVDDFNIDEGVWHIPGDRRKHEKPHSVALTGAALAVVKDALNSVSAGDWLLPNQGKTAPIRTEGIGGAMEKLLGDDAPTPHAFRHTVATELEHLEFDELEVARVLGHQSKTVTGRVYINRRALNAQKRALEAWERHLLNISGENVVVIEGARA